MAQGLARSGYTLDRSGSRAISRNKEGCVNGWNVLRPRLISRENVAKKMYHFESRRIKAIGTTDLESGFEDFFVGMGMGDGGRP